MGVHGANKAVSGCNILILTVDASVLPPFREGGESRTWPDFAAAYGRFWHGNLTVAQANTEGVEANFK
jgi:hypothetical protein